MARFQRGMGYMTLVPEPSLTEANSVTIACTQQNRMNKRDVMLPNHAIDDNGCRSRDFRWELTVYRRAIHWRSSPLVLLM